MVDINKYIDQTILRPDASEKDILEFVDDVNIGEFYAAVVNPCWVNLVHSRISSDIKVCSVVSFPFGASNTKIKALATEDLIQRGCDEIDMVMNIGKFKDSDYAYVAKDIQSVVKAAHGRIVKVIIETCLLTDDEKKAAAQIIMENGAKFVKTSTGFSTKGAQIKDVEMLRSVVGPDFGVKASGGIRDYVSAVEFIKAGANRLGTSAGVKILKRL